MAKKANGCLLGKDASSKCSNGCALCGWNQEEHTIRKKAIINGELKCGDDGLKRLYIKKEEGIKNAD
jgi:hypothetical protein